MSKSIGLPQLESAASYSSSSASTCKSNFNSHQAIKHSTGSSPIAIQNKQPRNTHRHHRKPEANLNHLLNFSYARTSPANNVVSTTRYRKTNPTYGRGSGHHPMDKAQFVNANYRFVVHPSGDYRSNLVDADIPIPWENVLQVLGEASTQRDACPICLEDVPVAPRMAKCGHIFCYPCALRYLDSPVSESMKSNKSWRKCPICFDGIYERELRPVRFLSDAEPPPSVGNEVVLQLMKRENGSIFALPSSSTSLDSQTVPWVHTLNVLQYARLLKGDYPYIESQAEAETQALCAMQAYDADSYGDDGKWTTIAIDHIGESSKLMRAIGSAPSQHIKVESSSRRQRQPIIYNDSPGPTTTASDTVSTADEVGGNYHFYQPKAGQHYYLSALDIRILKRAFGSFDQMPQALITRVEHLTTVTVDDEIRKRAKYLAHLPIGCEIVFIECNWAGVLESSVLSLFKADVDRRRKKRNDKAITEESARRKAQAIEDRRQRATLGEPVWHEDAETSYFARHDESNMYEVFAQDMSHSLEASPPIIPHDEQVTRSIWGQPIVHPTQAVQDEAPHDEWQEQLSKFYEDNAMEASLQSSAGSKAKTKKKKLVLMSTGGGRRA